MLRYFIGNGAVASFRTGQFGMARNDNVFVTNSPRPAPVGDAVQKKPVPLMFRVTSPAIVLDMGEASREQGFRQNGCR